MLVPGIYVAIQREAREKRESDALVSLTAFAVENYIQKCFVSRIVYVHAEKLLLSVWLHVVQMNCLKVRSSLSTYLPQH